VQATWGHHILARLEQTLAFAPNVLQIALFSESSYLVLNLPKLLHHACRLVAVCLELQHTLISVDFGNGYVAQVRLGKVGASVAPHDDAASHVHRLLPEALADPAAPGPALPAGSAAGAPPMAPPTAGAGAEGKISPAAIVMRSGSDRGVTAASTSVLLYVSDVRARLPGDGATAEAGSAGSPADPLSAGFGSAFLQCMVTYGSQPSAYVLPRPAAAPSEEQPPAAGPHPEIAKRERVRAHSAGVEAEAVADGRQMHVRCLFLSVNVLGHLAGPVVAVTDMAVIARWLNQIELEAARAAAVVRTPSAGGAGRAFRGSRWLGSPLAHVATRNCSHAALCAARFAGTAAAASLRLLSCGCVRRPRVRYLPCKPVLTFSADVASAACLVMIPDSRELSMLAHHRRLREAFAFSQASGRGEPSGRPPVVVPAVPTVPLAGRLNRLRVHMQLRDSDAAARQEDLHLRSTAPRPRRSGVGTSRPGGASARQPDDPVNPAGEWLQLEGGASVGGATAHIMGHPVLSAGDITVASQIHLPSVTSWAGLADASSEAGVGECLAVDIVPTLTVESLRLHVNSAFWIGAAAFYQHSLLRKHLQRSFAAEVEATESRHAEIPPAFATDVCPIPQRRSVTFRLNAQFLLRQLEVAVHAVEIDVPRSPLGSVAPVIAGGAEPIPNAEPSVMLAFAVSSVTGVVAGHSAVKPHPLVTQHRMQRRAAGFALSAVSAEVTSVTLRHGKCSVIGLDTCGTPRDTHLDWGPPELAEAPILHLSKASVELVLPSPDQPPGDGEPVGPRCRLAGGHASVIFPPALMPLIGSLVRGGHLRVASLFSADQLPALVETAHTDNVVFPDTRSTHEPGNDQWSWYTRYQAAAGCEVLVAQEQAVTRAVVAADRQTLPTRHVGEIFEPANLASASHHAQQSSTPFGAGKEFLLEGDDAAAHSHAFGIHSPRTDSRRTAAHAYDSSRTTRRASGDYASEARASARSAAEPMICTCSSVARCPLHVSSVLLPRQGQVWHRTGCRHVPLPDTAATTLQRSLSGPLRQRALGELHTPRHFNERIVLEPHDAGRDAAETGAAAAGHRLMHAHARSEAGIGESNAVLSWLSSFPPMFGTFEHISVLVAYEPKRLPASFASPGGCKPAAAAANQARRLPPLHLIHVERLSFGADIPLAASEADSVGDTSVPLCSWDCTDGRVAIAACCCKTGSLHSRHGVGSDEQHVCLLTPPKPRWGLLFSSVSLFALHRGRLLRALRGEHSPPPPPARANAPKPDDGAVWGHHATTSTESVETVASDSASAGATATSRAALEHREHARLRAIARSAVAANAQSHQPAGCRGHARRPSDATVALEQANIVTPVASAAAATPLRPYFHIRQFGLEQVPVPLLDVSGSGSSASTMRPSDARADTLPAVNWFQSLDIFGDAADIRLDPLLQAHVFVLIREITHTAWNMLDDMREGFAFVRYLTHVARRVQLTDDGLATLAPCPEYSAETLQRPACEAVQLQQQALVPRLLLAEDGSLSSTLQAAVAWNAPALAMPLHTAGAVATLVHAAASPSSWLRTDTSGDGLKRMRFGDITVTAFLPADAAASVSTWYPRGYDHSAALPEGGGTSARTVASSVPAHVTPRQSRGRTATGPRRSKRPSDFGASPAVASLTRGSADATTGRSEHHRPVPPLAAVPVPPMWPAHAHQTPVNSAARPSTRRSAVMSTRGDCARQSQQSQPLFERPLWEVCQSVAWTGMGGAAERGTYSNLPCGPRASHLRASPLGAPAPAKAHLPAGLAFLSDSELEDVMSGRAHALRLRVSAFASMDLPANFHLGGLGLAIDGEEVVTAGAVDVLHCVHNNPALRIDYAMQLARLTLGVAVSAAADADMAGAGPVAGRAGATPATATAPAAVGSGVASGIATPVDAPVGDLRSLPVAGLGEALRILSKAQPGALPEQTDESVHGVQHAESADSFYLRRALQSISRRSVPGGRPADRDTCHVGAALAALRGLWAGNPELEQLLLGPIGFRIETHDVGLALSYGHNLGRFIDSAVQAAQATVSVLSQFPGHWYTEDERHVSLFAPRRMDLSLLPTNADASRLRAAATALDPTGLDTTAESGQLSQRLASGRSRHRRTPRAQSSALSAHREFEGDTSLTDNSSPVTPQPNPLGAGGCGSREAPTAVRRKRVRPLNVQVRSSVSSLSSLDTWAALPPRTAQAHIASLGPSLNPPARDSGPVVDEDPAGSAARAPAPLRRSEPTSNAPDLLPRQPSAFGMSNGPQPPLGGLPASAGLATNVGVVHCSCCGGAAQLVTKEALLQTSSLLTQQDWGVHFWLSLADSAIRVLDDPLEAWLQTVTPLWRQCAEDREALAIVGEAAQGHHNGGHGTAPPAAQRGSQAHASHTLQSWVSRSYVAAARKLRSVLEGHPADRPGPDGSNSSLFVSHWGGDRSDASTARAGAGLGWASAAEGASASASKPQPVLMRIAIGRVEGTVHFSELAAGRSRRHGVMRPPSPVGHRSISGTSVLGGLDGGPSPLRGDASPHWAAASLGAGPADQRGAMCRCASNTFRAVEDVAATATFARAASMYRTCSMISPPRARLPVPPSPGLAAPAMPAPFVGRITVGVSDLEWHSRNESKPLLTLPHVSALVRARVVPRVRRAGDGYAGAAPQRVEIFPDSFSSLFMPALPYRIAARVSVQLTQPTLVWHISALHRVNEFHQVVQRCQPTRMLSEALTPAAPNILDVLATSFVRTRLSVSLRDAACEVALTRYLNTEGKRCRSARIAIQSLVMAADSEHLLSTVDAGRITVSVWPLAPLEGGVVAVIPGIGASMLYAVTPYVRDAVTDGQVGAAVGYGAGVHRGATAWPEHAVTLHVDASVGPSAYTSRLMAAWRQTRIKGAGGARPDAVGGPCATATASSGDSSGPALTVTALPATVAFVAEAIRELAPAASSIRFRQSKGPSHLHWFCSPCAPLILARRLGELGQPSPAVDDPFAWQCAARIVRLWQSENPMASISTAWLRRAEKPHPHHHPPAPAPRSAVSRGGGSMLGRPQSSLALRQRSTGTASSSVRAPNSVLPSHRSSSSEPGSASARTPATDYSSAEGSSAAHARRTTHASARTSIARRGSRGRPHGRDRAREPDISTTDTDAGSNSRSSSGSESDTSSATCTAWSSDSSAAAASRGRGRPSHLPHLTSTFLVPAAAGQPSGAPHFRASSQLRGGQPSTLPPAVAAPPSRAASRLVQQLQQVVPNIIRLRASSTCAFEVLAWSHSRSAQGVTARIKPDMRLLAVLRREYAGIPDAIVTGRIVVPTSVKEVHRALKAGVAASAASDKWSFGLFGRVGNSLAMLTQLRQTAGKLPQLGAAREAGVGGPVGDHKPFLPTLEENAELLEEGEAPELLDPALAGLGVEIWSIGQLSAALPGLSLRYHDGDTAWQRMREAMLLGADGLHRFHSTEALHPAFAAPDGGRQAHDPRRPEHPHSHHSHSHASPLAHRRGSIPDSAAGGRPDGAAAPSAAPLSTFLSLLAGPADPGVEVFRIGSASMLQYTPEGAVREAQAMERACAGSAQLHTQVASPTGSSFAASCGAPSFSPPPRRRAGTASAVFEFGSGLDATSGTFPQTTRHTRVRSGSFGGDFSSFQRRPEEGADASASCGSMFSVEAALLQVQVTASIRKGLVELLCPWVEVGMSVAPVIERALGLHPTFEENGCRAGSLADDGTAHPAGVGVAVAAPLSPDGATPSATPSVGGRGLPNVAAARPTSTRNAGPAVSLGASLTGGATVLWNSWFCIRASGLELCLRDDALKAAVLVAVPSVAFEGEFSELGDKERLHLQVAGASFFTARALPGAPSAHSVQQGFTHAPWLVHPDAKAGGGAMGAEYRAALLAVADGSHAARLQPWCAPFEGSVVVLVSRHQAAAPVAAAAALPLLPGAAPVPSTSSWRLSTPGRASLGHDALRAVGLHLQPPHKADEAPTFTSVKLSVAIKALNLRIGPAEYALLFRVMDAVVPPDAEQPMPPGDWASIKALLVAGKSPAQLQAILCEKQLQHALVTRRISRLAWLAAWVAQRQAALHAQTDSGHRLALSAHTRRLGAAVATPLVSQWSVAGQVTASAAGPLRDPSLRALATEHHSDEETPRTQHASHVDPTFHRPLGQGVRRSRGLSMLPQPTAEGDSAADSGNESASGSATSRPSRRSALTKFGTKLKTLFNPASRRGAGAAAGGTGAQRSWTEAPHSPGRLAELRGPGDSRLHAASGAAAPPPPGHSRFGSPPLLAVLNPLTEDGDGHELEEDGGGDDDGDASTDSLGGAGGIRSSVESAPFSSRDDLAADGVRALGGTATPSATPRLQPYDDAPGGSSAAAALARLRLSRLRSPTSEASAAAFTHSEPGRHSHMNADEDDSAASSRGRPPPAALTLQHIAISDTGAEVLLVSHLGCASRRSRDSAEASHAVSLVSTAACLPATVPAAASQPFNQHAPLAQMRERLEAALRRAIRAMHTIDTHITRVAAAQLEVQRSEDAANVDLLLRLGELVVELTDLSSAAATAGGAGGDGATAAPAVSADGLDSAALGTLLQQSHHHHHHQQQPVPPDHTQQFPFAWPPVPAFREGIGLKMHLRQVQASGIALGSTAGRALVSITGVQITDPRPRALYPVILDLWQVGDKPSNSTVVRGAYGRADGAEWAMGATASVAPTPGAGASSVRARAGTLQAAPLRSDVSGAPPSGGAPGVHGASHLRQPSAFPAEAAPSSAAFDRHADTSHAGDAQGGPEGGFDGGEGGEKGVWGDGGEDAPGEGGVDLGLLSELGVHGLTTGFAGPDLDAVPSSSSSSPAPAPAAASVAASVARGSPAPLRGADGAPASTGAPPHLPHGPPHAPLSALPPHMHASLRHLGASERFLAGARPLPGPAAGGASFAPASAAHRPAFLPPEGSSAAVPPMLTLSMQLAHASVAHRHGLAPGGAATAADAPAASPDDDVAAGSGGGEARVAGVVQHMEVSMLPLRLCISMHLIGQLTAMFDLKPHHHLDRSGSAGGGASSGAEGGPAAGREEGGGKLKHKQARKTPHSRMAAAFVQATEAWQERFLRSAVRAAACLSVLMHPGWRAAAALTGVRPPAASAHKLSPSASGRAGATSTRAAAALPPAGGAGDAALEAAGLPAQVQPALLAICAAHGLPEIWRMSGFPEAVSRAAAALEQELAAARHDLRALLRSIDDGGWPARVGAILRLQPDPTRLRELQMHTHGTHAAGGGSVHHHLYEGPGLGFSPCLWHLAPLTSAAEAADSPQFDVIRALHPDAAGAGTEGPTSRYRSGHMPLDLLHELADLAGPPGAAGGAYSARGSGLPADHQATGAVAASVMNHAAILTALPSTRGLKAWSVVELWKAALRDDSGDDIGAVFLTASGSDRSAGSEQHPTLATVGSQASTIHAFASPVDLPSDSSHGRPGSGAASPAAAGGGGGGVRWLAPSAGLHDPLLWHEDIASVAMSGGWHPARWQTRYRAVCSRADEFRLWPCTTPSYRVPSLCTRHDLALLAAGKPVAPSSAGGSAAAQAGVASVATLVTAARDAEGNPTLAAVLAGNLPADSSALHVLQSHNALAGDLLTDMGVLAELAGKGGTLRDGRLVMLLAGSGATVERRQAPLLDVCTPPASSSSSSAQGIFVFAAAESFGWHADSLRHSGGMAASGGASGARHTTSPARGAAALFASPYASALEYSTPDPESAFSARETVLLFKHLRLSEVQVLASFRGSSAAGLDSFERIALKLHSKTYHSERISVLALLLKLRNDVILDVLSQPGRNLRNIGAFIGGKMGLRRYRAEDAQTAFAASGGDGGPTSPLVVGSSALEAAGGSNGPSFRPLQNMAASVVESVGGGIPLLATAAAMTGGLGVRPAPLPPESPGRLTPLRGRGTTKGTAGSPSEAAAAAHVPATAGEYMAAARQKVKQSRMPAFLRGLIHPGRVIAAGAAASTVAPGPHPVVAFAGPAAADGGDASAVGGAGVGGTPAKARARDKEREREKMSIGGSMDPIKTVVKARNHGFFPAWSGLANTVMHPMQSVRAAGRGPLEHAAIADGSIAYGSHHAGEPLHGSHPADAHHDAATFGLHR